MHTLEQTLLTRVLCACLVLMQASVRRA